MKGRQLVWCCALILAAYVPTAHGQQESTSSPKQISFGGVYLPNAKRAQVQGSPLCPGDICPGLGNGFYLPSINSRSINTGGRVFFTNRKLGSGGCAVISDAKVSTRDFVTSDSMQELVTQSMSEANISGSYSTSALSMQATAQATSGYASDITTMFHSTHMDIEVVSSSIDFQEDSSCFSEANLDPAFLQRFGSLALIDASNVGGSTSWSPYVQFLHDQGSHILMQQQIGSRFQQWESIISSASDIDSTLQIKACADVEGVQAGGGWSIQSCGGYSSDQKQKASATQTQQRTYVFGGTTQARNDLIKKVNQENLDAFIDSSTKGDQAIRFIFKPIWELLYGIYEPACAAAKGSAACSNLQRAVILQAAYEGWTAIGCPPLDARGAYQTMATDGQTTLGITTYKCAVSKTGCRSGDDCHIGGALGTVCYCYGAGCLDQGDQISQGTNPPLYRDTVRGNQSGSYSEGVNNSCYYHAGAYCNCDGNWAGGLLGRTLYLQSAPAAPLLSQRRP